MKLTELHKDVMKRTLSVPGNRFGTSYGSIYSGAFEDLVRLGLAVKESPKPWMGCDVVYRLTSPGKIALKQLHIPSKVG